MSGLPKAYELVNLGKNDLNKQLKDLKEELSSLRVHQVAGGNASKLGRIREVRKSIARVLTISHKKQRDELKKYYADKKYKPLDLRPKLTRAMRRRLSPSEANKKTARQIKRAIHFPTRKYAIRADN